jgi:hypothetical protein
VEAIPVAGALRFELLSEGKFDNTVPRGHRRGIRERRGRPEHRTGRGKRGKRRQ